MIAPLREMNHPRHLHGMPRARRMAATILLRQGPDAAPRVTMRKVLLLIAGVGVVGGAFVAHWMGWI